MRTGSLAAARGAARALLDVAEAQADPAAVQAGLRESVALLKDHPELQAALSLPALGAERRKQVVGAVWKGTPELLRRFLELLAEHGQIRLLPAIETAYTALWNARRGVVAAEAVTAVPLGADAARALAEAIRRTTGLQAELQERSDPAVLGGVLLRMGGRTYDGTVRGRLRALGRTLRGEIGS